MPINLIDFNTSIGQQKPESIIHKDTACPFCDRKSLTGIIAEEAGMILLKNKYNVIEGADQFVLIESRSCHADMPDYTREQMRRLIGFGLHHWRIMLESGRYQEVVFFKNYGPLSGGTIRHPHMQLIGFPKIDKELFFRPEEFKGPVIARKAGVELSLSEAPRVGFWELNVVPEALNSQDSVDALADFIQFSVDYLMHHFHSRCQSYNIFFYHADRQVYVKIMPRFATSPMFIGYNIHFRPTNLLETAEKIKALYLNEFQE